MPKTGRKGSGDFYKYNQKFGAEIMVRKNLMNFLVPNDLYGDLFEERDRSLFEGWVKQAANPLEGMCVGWSLMFIEDEELTTKVWENLSEENPKITPEDKRLYQDFAKKLWYRYINTTGELESQKREFPELPLKMTEDDLKLMGVKKEGKDMPCKDVNNAKTDNDLYDILLNKVTKIIENETNAKSRHYIKIDNDSHSVVIAFNAFQNNKNRFVIETELNGIEGVENNHKSAITEILKGGFGNDVVNTSFSIENFSRNLEHIKKPPSSSTLKTAAYHVLSGRAATYDDGGKESEGYSK